MTNLREAEMALEALGEIEWSNNAEVKRRRRRSHARVLAMAEQPAQQEPVANIRTWRKNGELHAELWNWDRGIESLPDGEHDLYTSPPAQRTWVGLTEKEIDTVMRQALGYGLSPSRDDLDFARAIEAKLKEKNNG